MRTRLRLSMVGLAAVAVAGTALIGAGTAAATPTVSVLVRGLNSPRYLTFGPGGHLYVAVAGTGGRYSCIAGLGTRGTATRFCAGKTSAVDEITSHDTVAPLIKFLGSVREADTGEVTGASAVTFHGSDAVVLQGNGQSDQVGQSALSDISGSGESGYLQAQEPIRVRVVKVVDRDGRKVREVVHELQKQLISGANISGFAATHPQPAATLGGTPGETLYDSNPHDLVPYEGGYAVADAGANDLVLARPREGGKGRISLLARFPTAPQTAPAGVLGPEPVSVDAQAVPSSVTVGPDGALYVGVLRGIPGLPGSAEVYRVLPGQAPVAVVTGLTRVSDLAFNRAGRLLILENNTGGALAPPSTPGALLSATLEGTTPVTATNLGVPGLLDPTGLAINSSGDAFITNDSSGAHPGEIIKVSGLG